MTSPEKIAANRANALKSTGPKTQEGKVRSSQNSFKHGLAADTENTPGDPPGAFRQSLAEWFDDLQPQGIAQKTLVERACRAAWNLRRCDRHEDAVAARRDRDAPEEYDRAAADRAEAIGRQLLDGGADERPWALVARLRASAAGAAWLLDRWADLSRALESSGTWDRKQRLAAIRLLGASRETTDAHPVASQIMVEEDWHRRRPSFDEGTAGWKADREVLRAVVRDEQADLERRLAETLKDRATEDRAGAADRLRFDDERSLTLCLRYATASSRDLHRSLSDLAKLRKSAGDGPKASSRECEPRNEANSGADTGLDFGMQALDESQVTASEGASCRPEQGRAGGVSPLSSTSPPSTSPPSTSPPSTSPPSTSPPGQGADAPRSPGGTAAPSQPEEDMGQGRPVAPGVESKARNEANSGADTGSDPTTQTPIHYDFAVCMAVLDEIDSGLREGPLHGKSDGGRPAVRARRSPSKVREQAPVRV